MKNIEINVEFEQKMYLPTVTYYGGLPQGKNWIKEGEYIFRDEKVFT